MGRELRRVIANWSHPQETKYDPWTRQEKTNYLPMHDRPWIEAIGEWIKNHELWEQGEHPDQKKDYAKDCKYYAEYGGDAPKFKYYRPDWKKEDMTWYQVYETVSEGTPVTPAFATREELVEYLIFNGDFWDQQRRLEGNSIMDCQPWKRKTAEHFVFGDGWAPSLVFTTERGCQNGVDAMADLAEDKKIKEG